MKKLIGIICLGIFMGGAKVVLRPPLGEGAGEITSLNEQVVEASCGQCLFDMGEGGCDLAVRIDGKGYFVDGSGIDDHGDSHGKDGFCSVIRQAKVTGKIQDERFVVTAFELLPLKK